MAPLSISSFLSDLRFPFVTNLTPLSALLLITVIFTAALPFFKKEKSIPSEGLLLISVIFLTLFFAYSVSFLSGRSLFTARYLVPALSVFWLGNALLWDNAISLSDEKNYLTPFLIALIAVTGVTGYLMTFREEYGKSAEPMKNYFEENIKDGDAYIIDEPVPEIEICFRYYFPDLEKTDWENADNIKGNLWYIEKNGPEDSIENAEKYRYNLIYIHSFFFDRYSFSLYRAEKSEE
jgi:hypothetical protein